MTDLALKQFIFCILSNLIYWNFNVFAFIAVVAIHNTSSSWCEYKINHCTEFITGQKFLVSFSYQGVSYIEGVETTFGLWSFLIIYTKQPTNSELGIYKWLDKNVSHVLNLRTLNSVYIYGLNQNLSHVLNPCNLNSVYIHG